MFGGQFKSFQKSTKNSSQKNAGVLTVTTGLPERPRIAMETAHFFFMEQAHKTPRMCHEISYYCPEAAKDVRPH